MGNAKRNIKKKAVQPQGKFNWLFVPITFILIVVPLIVRLAVIEIDEGTLEFYMSSTQSDLYGFCKMVALIIGGIAIIIFSSALFKKIFEKKDRMTTISLIAAGAFLLFTLISAIFAGNKVVGFAGLFMHSEGFLTIACYILAFAYTIYVFKKTEDYRYIVVPLIIVVAVNAFFGAFQFFGNDLITSEIGMKFIIPGRYQEQYNQLDKLYKDKFLYGTLANYNYMGSFSAMMVPLFGVITLFQKDIKNRIILGATTALSVFLLFGSMARSGIVAIAAIALVCIVLFGRIIIKHWKVSGCILAALIALTVGLNFITKGAVFRRIPSIVNDAFSIFKNDENFDYKDHIPVRNVGFTNDGKLIEIETQADKLYVSWDGTSLSFKDQNDKEVNFTEDRVNELSAIYTSNDKRFPKYKFQTGLKSTNSKRTDNIRLDIRDGLIFFFGIEEDYSMHHASPYNFRKIQLEEPETIGFKGNEKLGSARGYIWSRTLPMLKETFLIGYGPDNYVFHFPQYELLAKYYSYGTINTVIANPHNMYLQIFVNNGGIAFLAFMVLIVLYIADCFRLYAFKLMYTREQGLGIASFLAIIGYLVAGFFNDSLNLFSPVAWIILGAGVAVNAINRKKRLEENQTVQTEKLLK